MRKFTLLVKIMGKSDRTEKLSLLK